MKKYSLFMVVALWATTAFAQPTWRADLQKYINSKLLKADGGYGWEDQPDAFLTVCYAVTGTLNDINALPADKARLAEFIRTHHPQHGPNHEAGPSGSDLHNMTYEQIQAIRWLGGDLSSFAPDVTKWKTQAGILANYEDHKYAVLFQDAMIPICQQLVQVPLTDPAGFIAYFQSRRRSNGSFNSSPAAAGGDGNILNTYWSLYAMEVLKAPKEKVAETITWLQDCQLPNGGFTHQPNPQIGANDDAIYTWAAVKALALLGAKPKNVQGVINYILSLHSADGGFGDRPGLHSTPVATWYAIDALSTLHRLSALDKAAAPKPLVEPEPDFTGYKVFTVQFQAQGGGSPQEAVELADKLKIQLWGAKYPVKGWVAEAQRIANERHVPVTFFLADEPHDNDVTVAGMGSFNHVLDYVAPAGHTIHFKDTATYDELKNTTLQQLNDVNGGLLLQVSNNEPLARLLLDESLNNHRGYLGISTIHFGQNFSFWLPYLNEYRYRYPMVTLQDAHGVESWWWADELTHHRTLFIAKEATYEAMITALKNNWIVGVRHDSLSENKTRMLGGTAAARKFFAAHEADWKWWDAQDRLPRPQVAITVIGKDDVLEAGHPADGLNIRIRCRWNNNRETLRSPAAVLTELKVDGVPVTARDTVIHNRRGAIADAYYLYHWGNPTRGVHKIEATLRDLATNETHTYATDYEAGAKVNYALCDQDFRPIGQHPNLPAGAVYTDKTASAEARAADVVKRLPFEEKIRLTGGWKQMHFPGIPQLGIPPVYFSDASQGIHLKSICVVPEKSTAFPAEIALAATWNRDLAWQYASALGEECQAWGINVLLGPGLNLYRNAEGGRNFEYMGEDPFLTATLGVAYVKGLQNTGTIATIKHFIGNEQEFARHVVDEKIGERALNEIYLPPYKAAIQEGGALAVMTGNNQVNGFPGAADAPLSGGVLRKEYGFKGVIMSDWANSLFWTNRLELETGSGHSLLMDNNETFAQYMKAHPEKQGELDKMVFANLYTFFKSGVYDRPYRDPELVNKIEGHKVIAQRTAEEAITLLKNEDHILPLKADRIVVLGTEEALTMYTGKGSGNVLGYDHVDYLTGLRAIYGDKISTGATDEEIKTAGVLLYFINKPAGEGFDVPFDLPGIEEKINAYAALNKNIVVIYTGGNGFPMPWLPKVKGLVFAYLLGQQRGNALANVLSGKVNPSGKLPFTIEKDFNDSPAKDYNKLSDGNYYWKGGKGDSKKIAEQFGAVAVNYSEGIYIGYRWYEKKQIKPQFPFGFGLSYTTFKYSSISALPGAVSFSLTNTGTVDGAEVVQLYVRPVKPAVDRPLHELKGFQKVFLKAGETKKITLPLPSDALAYWEETTHQWRIDHGEYTIQVGSSSADIKQEVKIKN